MCANDTRVCLAPWVSLKVMETHVWCIMTFVVKPPLYVVDSLAFQLVVVVVVVVHWPRPVTTHSHVTNQVYTADPAPSGTSMQGHNGADYFLMKAFVKVHPPTALFASLHHHPAD